MKKGKEPKSKSAAEAEPKKEEKETDQEVADSRNPEFSEVLGEPKPNKKFYKKPLFWIGIVALVIGAVGVTLGLIYRNNIIKNKQTITDGWHQIAVSADRTVFLSDKIKSGESYKTYTDQLDELNRLVKDKQFNAAKMPTFLSNSGDVNNYRGFLGNFGQYTDKSNSEAQLIDDYTTADAEELKALSRQAKEAADNLKNNSDFLQDSMPEGIYEIASVLDKVKTGIDLKKTEEKAAVDAAAAQANKDAANKQTVQNNVEQFLNAFVVGNATNMRRYMTPAFQNEYDFNQLSPEARVYSYPNSYRVISVKKQDDGNYKATANIVFRYRDGSGQYTNGYDFGLVPVSSAIEWLINTEKTGSSY